MGGGGRAGVLSEISTGGRGGGKAKTHLQKSTGGQTSVPEINSGSQMSRLHFQPVSTFFTLVG